MNNGFQFLAILIGVLGAGLEESLYINQLGDVSDLAVHEAVHSFAC